jgi:hypothetical protein
MKHLLVAIGLAVLVSGCAEAVRGPRVVPYTDSHFYIRHVTAIDGAESVDRRASDICAVSGRQARRIDAYQFYAGDIRYATYVCG